MITTGPKNLNIVQSRAIVFNSKNELLLVSKNAKRWSLPGGTINKHSPLDKLAIEEVYEETGLKVKNPSLAYYLQETWSVDNDFWYFNEHIEYPFTACCFVFAYHCDIVGSEIIDPNWKDLDHEIIKFRKFVSEDEFLKIVSSKNLVQDELTGLNFEQIKDLRNQYLFL